MSAALESLSSQLRDAQAGLTANNLTWLFDRRAQALAHFERAGFPTLRHEDWKYTSVRNIERRQLALATPAAWPTKATALAAQFSHDASDGAVAVIHDGQLTEVVGQLEQGVRVVSLADALADVALCDIAQEHVATVANAESDGFAALNAAHLDAGVVLHVTAGTKVERPVTLLYAASGNDDATCNPRNLIVVEDDAKIAVIEHDVANSDGAYLHNSVTEVILREGAQLEHTKLQEESTKAFHIATLEAQLQSRANLVSHALSVGAAIHRSDINVHLLGEQASVTLNGLYIGSGRQHVDFHTRIHHAAPHCQSEQLYKGILSGSARGVFNGQVHVHEHAQKSDAQQANHNLLLSRNAEIDTKPQLEILADDVKCSHGTTVGQLDETMLFYLRSRGVPLAQAQGLLTYGFAHDIVERLSSSNLAGRMERLLVEALPHGDELRAIVE
jgi:Fe-S cluster assembly protein SufD